MKENVARSESGLDSAAIEAQRQARNQLFDLHNQLTMSPINLPHRNVLRELVSAAYHLTQELGTGPARTEEVCQKLALILDHLRRRA